MDSATILHPIRFRIVQLFLGEQGLTTAQLAQRLPEIPIATLYRHVGRLAKSDVIEVVKSEQVRGAIEKTYRLSGSFAQLGYDDFASMKTEELNATFIAFCASLIADFERYTGSGDVDLARDQAHFSQVPLWASDEEVAQFNDDMGAAIDRLCANLPDARRKLRIFSAIFIPRAPTGDAS